MNILVVSQYFWPENFKINDLVSELVKRGHIVTVLTGVPNYPKGEVFQDFINNPLSFSFYSGAEIVRVPMLPRGTSRLSLVLNYLSFLVCGSTYGFWRVKRRHFDIIFVNQLSPITSAIPAIIIRRVKKIPLVLWIQDLWPESLQATGIIQSANLLGLLSRLVRFIYSNCDLILVQSESFINHVKAYLSRDTGVFYFPNWAESNYSIKAKVCAHEVPPLPDSFDIMFAGNIGDAQDFPAILEAAEILKSHSHIRWLIVGDGRMSVWLADEIRRRGLHDCFLLLGHHKAEKMPSFFLHAKVMLVSLKDEPIFSMTIPSKLQTYLAAGKPILGMINGEGARAIIDSGSGLACPAGDSSALANLILKMSNMSNNQLEAMGAKGLEFNKRMFDKESLISNLELMLNKLINSSNPSLPIDKNGSN